MLHAWLCLLGVYSFLIVSCLAPGRGGAKRHRKILRDNIQGITKPVRCCLFIIIPIYMFCGPTHNDVWLLHVLRLFVVWPVVAELSVSRVLFMKRLGVC